MGCQRDGSPLGKAAGQQTESEKKTLTEPRFQTIVREDGILYSICGNEATRLGDQWTLEDSLALREAITALVTPGEPVFTMSDVRKISVSSGPSRRVPPIEGTARLALIVGSRLSRMLGLAYLGLNKPKCKTNLFTW